MKRWRALAAGLVAVIMVAALVALVLLSRESAPQPPTQPLADIPMAELVRVAVRGAEGGCLLERDPWNDWYVAAPVSARADQNHVIWLLEDLLGIETSAPAQVGQLDLASTGLLTPTAWITLTLRSGEERLLLVGDFDARFQCHYVRIGDQVYLFDWNVVYRTLRWLQDPPLPIEPTSAANGSRIGTRV